MLSSFNFDTPDYKADPFPYYARMREEGLSRLEPGGFLAVSRYADVVAILRDPEVFKASGLRRSLEPAWLGPHPCTKTMHSLDPPEHTKMRGLVNTAFTPSVLERTAPFLRTLVDSVVGSFATRGEVEFVADVATPLTAGAIGHFLGLDPGLHAKCKEWSDGYLSITPSPRSPEHEATVRKALDEMQRYFTSVIEERRRSPGEDLVSGLARAEIDGERLTERELIGFLAMLLVGGMETTANLLSRSMLMLAQRPDLLDRLRADPALVPAFINELLRYDPSSHGMPRYVARDTEIAGHAVSAGTSVVLMLASANRDPLQFPEPDVFDLARDTRGMVSFGQGIHFCLGMALTKLQARLALGELCARFRRFELVEPTLEWTHTVIVRGPTRLRLRGLLA
ncbi:cytochrome P450 [Nannocystis punicea]|uniref:Cytochrome P450 n=1 Tax=Nannocystis punicea TaxID=2995304 RepID=A0ABY7GXV1_9BACT|nr:cytochrome P450 [Nannocystis poenicansa]WAS91742.1 cytochrome P450 [Nannocystis poenicansa]